MLTVVAFPAFKNRAGNPYNALLYDNMAPYVRLVTDYQHFRCMPAGVDIFHLHWPDLTVSGRQLPRVIARSLFLLTRLAWCKWRGGKVIWTVHNLAPHDYSHCLIAAVYWPLFFRLLDGAIFLSRRAREQGLAALPPLRSKPSAVIPHGHYKPVLSATGYVRGRVQARTRHQLPQDRFIYLYFGQIRDYKNVELLLTEFLALGEPDSLLLIAGGCPDQVRRSWLTDAAAAHDNVRCDIRHIPDDVLFEYLDACDLVVLPYKRILNSGSVMMALSAARPVLAPNVGSLPEISSEVGRDWLMTYDGNFDRTVLSAARAGCGGSRTAPDLATFDWDPIAQQTASFYREVRGLPVHASSPDPRDP